MKVHKTVWTWYLGHVMILKEKEINEAFWNLLWRSNQLLMQESILPSRKEMKTFWVAYMFILWYLTVEMVLRLETWPSVFISERACFVYEAACLDESHLPLFVSQPVRKLSSPLLAVHSYVMWITGITWSIGSLLFKSCPSWPLAFPC